MNAESAPHLWQRLEAFRELLKHGHGILGEAATLVENTETLARSIQEERDAAQGMRVKLETCQARLDAECARSEGLSLELDALRAKLPEPGQQAEQQQTIASLAARLKSAELELRETKTLLHAERERRNRAITLIRPDPPVPASSCPTQKEEAEKDPHVLHTL